MTDEREEKRRGKMEGIIGNLQVSWGHFGDGEYFGSGYGFWVDFHFAPSTKYFASLRPQTIKIQ